MAFRPDEGPRLQADLGDVYFLVLRNHGLLTCGTSIPDAFLYMYLFEAACRIQVDALAGGSALTLIGPSIVLDAAHALQVQTESQGGRFLWPTLIRQLDRLDQGYQD